tara:strand:- start:20 stop:931 length:912 start_codon:yes stop_codon:yes gene_type:complete
MTNIIKLNNNTEILPLEPRMRFDLGLKDLHTKGKDGSYQVFEGEQYMVMDITNDDPIWVVGGKFSVKDAEYYKAVDVTTEALIKLGLHDQCKVTDQMYEGKRKFIRRFTFDDITITPDTRKVGDVVRYTVILRTSLDGSWVTSIQVYPERLACLNGQTAVMEDMKLVHRWKHTAGFNVQNLQRAFEVGIDTFQSMKPWFETLNSKEISMYDFKTLLKQTMFKKQAEKDSSLKDNKAYNWMIDQLVRESRDLGLTMYAVYNTLTNYSTHTPLRQTNTQLHNRVVTDESQIAMIVRSPQWHRLVA